MVRKIECCVFLETLFRVSLSEWLGHSKTCPQCREKCANKSVIKLYVDSCAPSEDKDISDLNGEQLKVRNLLRNVNSSTVVN